MTANDDLNPVALQCPQCGAGLPVTAEGHTVCRYCGSRLIHRGQVANSGNTKQVLVRGMRLKTLACSDAQGTGLEMFRLLVPVGWQV